MMESWPSWNFDGVVVLFMELGDEEMSSLNTRSRGGNAEGLDSLLDWKGCADNSRLLASVYEQTEKLSEVQHGDTYRFQRQGPAKARNMNVKDDMKPHLWSKENC